MDSQEIEKLGLATRAHLSPLDTRDWTLASAGASVFYSPRRIMDIEWMVASMQGHIGCCVGCTGEEVVRRIIFLLTGKQCNPNTPDELSFRFVYAVAKALDGVSDEGTFPALVAKIIRTIGVPLAKYCPNDVTLDHEAFVYNRTLRDKDAIIAALGQEAWDSAQAHRSGADFNEPISLDGIKKAINYAADNKGGVMILRQVGDTYWKGADGVTTWDKAKLLPIRVPAVFTSGHEEFLHGYLDITLQDRAALDAKTATIQDILAKYPDGTTDANGTRTQTVIFWLNHWSEGWADRGRGWEYADVWLPHVYEMRVVVASVPVVDTFRYTFASTLKQGSKGADVVALQHVLKLEDCFDYPTFTGNYQAITQQGVKKLQEKYADAILKPLGLTQGTGNFGVATMAWVNAKYGIIK